MSDTISEVSTLPPAPSAPPPWTPATPPATTRWPGYVSLVIALAAVGVAIGAWFSPLRHNEPSPAPSPPSFSDQQVTEAKAKVCAAYEQVHKAVLSNTGRSGGSDPTAQLAVAANARMALFDGGQYLLSRLTEEPATPPDLAKATRALVASYQQLAIDYMADATDREKEASGDAVNKAGTTVYQICK